MERRITSLSRSRATNHLLIPAVFALALAACGSSGAAGSSQSQATTGQIGPVTVMAWGAHGNILANPTGKALYTPDQEATGTIHCTSACLSFWVPLAAGSSIPAAPAGAPKLGVIDRPDGIKQVTAAGRPLYMFSLDSSGKVTGDGLADDFGGQHLTWHVVHADGSMSTATTPPTSPSGDSGGGGGYGGY